MNLTFVRCGTKPAAGRAFATACALVSRTWAFWQLWFTTTRSPKSATRTSARGHVRGGIDPRQRWPGGSLRAGAPVAGCVTGRRGGSIGLSPSSNALRTRERAYVGAEHDHQDDDHAQDREPEHHDLEGLD